MAGGPWEDYQTENLGVEKPPWEDYAGKKSSYSKTLLQPSLPKKSERSFALRAADAAKEGMAEVNPLNLLAVPYQDIKRLWNGENLLDLYDRPSKKLDFPILGSLAGTIGELVDNDAMPLPALVQGFGHTAAGSSALTENLAAALNPNGTVEDLRARKEMLRQNSPDAFQLGKDIGYITGVPGKVLGTIGRSLGWGKAALASGATNTAIGQMTADNPAEHGVGSNLLDFLFGALGPVAQRFITPPKLTNEFKPNVIPEAVNAQAAIKSATGVDVPLAPDQLLNNQGVSFLANTARETPGGAGRMNKFGQQQLESVQKAWDTVEPGGGRIGVQGEAGATEQVLKPRVDDTAVLDQAVTGIQNSQRTLSDAAKVRYGVLDQMTPQGSIDVPPNLTATIEKNLDKLKLGLEGREGESAKNIIQWMNDKFLKPAKISSSKDLVTGKVTETTTPTQTSFSDLQQLRHDLGVMAQESTSPNQRRIYSELIDAVDSDFDLLGQRAAVAGQPNVSAMLKETNNWYRSEKVKIPTRILDAVESSTDAVNPFSNKFGKQLVTFIRKNDHEQLGKLKNYIGEENFQPIAQRYQNYLDRGEVGDTYDLAGLKRRLGETNKKTLETVLGPGKANFYFGLAKIEPFLTDAQRYLTKTPPSLRNAATKVGTLVAPGTALGYLAGGGPTAAAAGVAAMGAVPIGSNIISRLYTNPEFIQKMIRVSTRPTGNQELMNIARRALMDTYKEESKTQDAPQIQKSPGE